MRTAVCGTGISLFSVQPESDWTLAKHAQVLFGQVWPWLPTAVMLLPLAMYDVVRLSNLFAGPVYRLRKHFAALREDIACAPLLFREEDYWRDLAAPINDMQAEILRLRTGIIELQKLNSASQSKSNVSTQKVVETNLQETGDSQSSPSESMETRATSDEQANIADVAIAPLPASASGTETAVPAQ